MKMVDGRMPPMDGRSLDGYTISSPCEHNGSCELKIVMFSRSLGTVTKMHIPVTSYGVLLSLGTGFQNLIMPVHIRSLKFGGTATYCRKSQI